MKKLFLLLLLTLSLTVGAQVSIYGKVFDNKGNPLSNAAVYLNNTTIGVTTDSHGAFLLSNIEHGYYTLVVSFMGYETSIYSVNTIDLPDEIVFKMVEKRNVLDEIVLKSVDKWSSKRAYFLRKFRENFLGTSFNAQKCQILNEDVIKFTYNEEKDIIEAYALSPIIVENKALGYKISYDLVHWRLEPLGVTYLGYTRFEELKGKPRKVRKWLEERELAYQGSIRHFLKATMNKDTLAGFVVEEVRLIPNPDRPSDEEIAKAQNLIKRKGNLQKNPMVRNIELDRQLKYADSIVSRAHLKKFVNIVIRPNLAIDDYLEEYEGGFYLYSDNELRVRYMLEYQESNYMMPGYHADDHQVSKLTLYDSEILLNPVGTFHNPLDVLMEGYWAFEKVGDLLPFNYKPTGGKPEPLNNR